MEIKNIRQKIATPIEYKAKENYWEMQFYVQIDEAHYPLYIELYKNDLIKYRMNGRLELKEDEESLLLSEIQKSRAFQKIMKKINETEQKMKERLTISELKWLKTRDEVDVIVFSFAHSMCRNNYEIKETMKGTLSQFIDTKEYDFLYFISKSKENGKTTLVPYDKYPLMFINKQWTHTIENLARFELEVEQKFPRRDVISTHRTFEEDVLKKIVTHPSLRVKLLTQ